MAGHGAARSAAYDAAARQQQRQLFMGMNAYERHKKMVHDLVAYYGGQAPQGGQVRPLPCLPRPLRRLRPGGHPAPSLPGRRRSAAPAAPGCVRHRPAAQPWP